MRDTPLKSYLLHLITFLGFNLFIAFKAFQKGSFYGLIGYLGTLGLIYGITILVGFLSQTYLKVKALFTSFISTLSLFLIILLVFGFQDILIVSLIPVTYFLVFELPRIGIIRLNNTLINQLASFFSKLFPFIVLIHFLLICIGLTFELPAIYDQWKVLIIEVPILSMLTWIYLNNLNLSIILKKGLRITVIFATSVTIITFGYYLVNRSIGSSELDKSYKLFEKGNYELVASKTEKILSIDPYNANAMFLSGCALTELSKFEAANEQFFEIIINPNTGKGLTKEQLDLVAFRRGLANYGIKQPDKIDSIKTSNAARLKQLKLLDPK